LFARWVRARGQERQQLKWFAYAAVVMISGFLLAFVPSDYPSLEVLWDIGMLVGIVGFAFLPIATAIAILKYRLYDIDVVINRTLVYGSLTALLALVYFGGVTATQTIFQTLTGQERQSQLAIVISTLVIAALFNPLRRAIQGFIDRRFYRRKYDARKTLESFSAKLRDETDLEALNAELVEVVKETM
jgi:MFS family permease